MPKFVYRFAEGAAEGSAEMRNLLGGKGANLAEMSNLGLPVPPGFTITTEVCTHYYENGEQWPEGLEADVDAALEALGSGVGRRFGDPANPLLVSVRSGARASMPGMMDTVLNLGLNDETVQGLARESGDERFARDSYRRFIQMYADVVLGLERREFETVIAQARRDAGVETDAELDSAALSRIIERYKAIVRQHTGKDFPQHARAQLWGAIKAVFASWMTPRAVAYRRLNAIPSEWGTAVNVQAMVFGNLGETSATGVAFTRNPSTGENALYGEFLINAQGEDVVAGIRTPQNITEEARRAAGSDKPSLESAMPDAFSHLVRVAETLERHYRDMQDLEFTIERGKLWMLQTRSGKRTARAALRIAVELVRDGLIDRNEALRRLDAESLNQLLHPAIDPGVERSVLARGLPASPGAACGEITFSAEAAERRAGEGASVILVRAETSPEDILGMHAAAGILTTCGGMTSHAAVVTRGMGKPCIVGASGIGVDEEAGTLTIGERTLRAGDVLTIDGTQGEVLDGAMPMIKADLSDDFATVMEWADAVARLEVRANADTAEDAETSLKFGARGIGLCRTEHMFFEEKRIGAVREMILAAADDQRVAALGKILPLQREDFGTLFDAMGGLPVTIRLLDPPLHEFLPKHDAEIEEIAASTGVEAGHIRQRLQDLSETNPMLGFRGCRLAIAYPEIADMQARAIFEAAVESEDRTGTPVHVEIMIPLVTGRLEFEAVKARVDAMGQAVRAETGRDVAYQVGTMIELPSASLNAGEIAEGAEFFSFGTNDMTQTALGISRDDASTFLGLYVKKGLMPVDPFVSIDRAGVGELVRIGVERGRAVRPDLKLGICGEHGGDPASILFFDEVGLDYVSCSPYRVPVARLAAAQAALAAHKRTATVDRDTLSIAAQ